MAVVTKLIAFQKIHVLNSASLSLGNYLQRTAKTDVIQYYDSKELCCEVLRYNDLQTRVFPPSMIREAPVRD